MHRFPLTLPFFCAIFFLLLGYGPLYADNFLNKSVQVGKTFSITIYTENLNEHFEIGSIEPPLISNTAIHITNDRRTFEFLPLSPGQATLSIRKIHFTNVIDDYIAYYLTIEPSKRIKITPLPKAVDKKLQQKKSAAKAGFKVIEKLYSSSLKNQALKQITEFKQQFPQSRYRYDVLLIQAAILEEQGNLKEASTLLENVLKENEGYKNLSAKKKVVLYQRLATLSRKMNENERAITLLLMAKELPALSPTNIELLDYKLATYYLKEKKYVPALSYYEKVYSNHLKKQQAYHLDLYDDTLMAMANILEVSVALRDTKRAYLLYGELIKTYPQSPLAKPAREKKEYLKRNFIEPK